MYDAVPRMTPASVPFFVSGFERFGNPPGQGERSLERDRTGRNVFAGVCPSTNSMTSYGEISP
jgi:hypothetical protein